MSKSAVTAWTALALLVVPAVTLTVVRLVDPEVGLLVQLQAFTPFALVPYALAAGVLLVLLARRVQPWALLLPPAVLVILGAGLHLSWVAPSYLGEGREPATGVGAGEEVVVLSVNLYHGRGDGATVVRESAERGVDLLVASEVTPRTLAAMERAGLDEVLPHRAGSPGGMYEGTMVFSREPMEDVRPVSGTAFDNLLVRTGDLDVLAAHPAAPLDPDLWRADHARLREVVAAERPDVVVGDLNATLDHAPVRRLLAEGYRDSAELLNAGLVTTWPANGLYPFVGLLPPTTAIDHLLLAPGWTVTETGTVEVPDTDHLAVLATVVPAA